MTNDFRASISTLFMKMGGLDAQKNLVFLKKNFFLLNKP